MTSTRKPNAETGPDLPHDDEPPFDLPQAPSSSNPQGESAGGGQNQPSISARAVAASRGAPAYLEGLNAEQREAVETTEGPLLVLAGAGTGKTRVLTTRIAHILATGRAYPSQILAVTFTNKAAREMRERIGALIGGTLEGMPWLGTFHSIGVKILRRHAELVGLKSGFTILDVDDQVRLMKQVIEAAGIDKDRWPARQLAGLIDSWKNRGLTPDKVPAGESFAFAGGKGAQPLCRLSGSGSRNSTPAISVICCSNVCASFAERPDVLADYHRRFRYILVDEYQDTNVAQYLWLRLLAQGSPNICCVGDDDQSIYGWRGAEVDNILRFEKDFPGAKVIRLERNYRSTANILAAASGLIAKNDGRLGKTLFTDGAAGTKIAVANFWDDEAEARAIGDDIENLQRNKEHLNDMAVLVRASSQMRAIRRSLHHARAPVSGDRRAAVLRAPGNQGRYRLSGRRRQSGQRFEVRAHHQCAEARPRRHVDQAHPRAGPRPRHSALSGRARNRAKPTNCPQRARKSLADLMRSFERWRSQSRSHAPHGSRRTDAG